jgi:hypothetical protein
VKQSSGGGGGGSGWLATKLSLSLVIKVLSRLFFHWVLLFCEAHFRIWSENFLI